MPCDENLLKTLLNGNSMCKIVVCTSFVYMLSKQNNGFGANLLIIDIIYLYNDFILMLTSI